MDFCKTCGGAGEAYYNEGTELNPSHQLATCEGCRGSGKANSYTRLVVGQGNDTREASVLKAARKLAEICKEKEIIDQAKEALKRAYGIADPEKDS